MAPVNNIERRAAKKLAATEGINYTEALRRLRITGVQPSAILAGLTLTTPSAPDQHELLVEQAFAAIMKQGGDLLKHGFDLYDLDLRARLTELLAPGQHPTLNKNVTTVMREGTPTGQAKAVSALTRAVVRWSCDLRTSKSVYVQEVRNQANSSVIEGWSLGNLLEELDLTAPIGDYTIDLTKEKGWTELSSRVEEAISHVGEYGSDGNVRLISRGLAAIGLASLHSVEKTGAYNFSTGFLAETTQDQKGEIERHGKEFVLWAGGSDNVNDIIRAAEKSRSLDPEILKLVMEA